MKKNNISGLALSFLIHGILLIILFLNFDFQDKNQVSIPGQKDIIFSELLENNNPDTNQGTNIKFAPPPSLLERPKNPISRLDTPPLIKQPIQKPRPTPIIKTLEKPHPEEIKAISGTQLNQLISLIYQAISRHKNYPEMAQELNQTGIVTVSFKIQPNGEISNLLLLHSSAYHDLDQAALNAVLAAQPFQGVQKYLTQAQTFKLNIEFQNLS